MASELQPARLVKSGASGGEDRGEGDWNRLESDFFVAGEQLEHDRNDDSGGLGPERVSRWQRWFGRRA